MSTTLRQEGEDLTLALRAETAVEFSKKVAQAWKGAMETGREKVVLLCDSRLRYALAQMLSRTVASLPVIAYDEITLGTEIEPVETISIEKPDVASKEHPELVGASKS